MFTIHWKDAGFSRTKIATTARKLHERLNELQHTVRMENYSRPEASLILPTENKFVRTALDLAKQCKADLVVVVGIGGSSLGTKAVQHALGNPNIIYAETVDPDTTAGVIRVIKATLVREQRVVINIISKSGTTTETISNADTILDAVGKHCMVVVTTDEGSPLELTARLHGYEVLSVPAHVGGRYSVFSLVGLFPLACAGVDISSLVDGAHHMLRECLTKDPSRNPALLLASIAYLSLKSGKRVHDTFVFSESLSAYGSWYRQLLAESIGKTPASAIIPTVSIGTTDLHSVGQLDLAGQNNTFYRFISVKKFDADLAVPRFRTFAALAPRLAGKKFSDIYRAILKGTQAAFKDRKRTFIEIELPDLSAETIGGLLQTEMASAILLGELLRVNAFDQPAVEEYKTATRALLR